MSVMDDLTRLLRIKQFVDGLVEDALADAASLPDTNEVQPRPLEEDLIDTSQASERFDIPRDTIARWCERHGIGRKAGGRWKVSVSALRRHLRLK